MWCDGLHTCRHLPTMAITFQRLPTGKKRTWKQKVSTKNLPNYIESRSKQQLPQFLNQIIIKFGIQLNRRNFYIPMHFLCRWQDPICLSWWWWLRSLKLSYSWQHVGHRPDAHSPMGVDCRTQTLQNRKKFRRLAATHNVGRRSKSCQLTSATEGQSADGERFTGKVTRGN